MRWVSISSLGEQTVHLNGFTCLPQAGAAGIFHAILCSVYSVFPTCLHTIYVCKHPNVFTVNLRKFTYVNINVNVYVSTSAPHRSTKLSLLTSDDAQRQRRLQKLDHHRNDNGCLVFVIKDYAYDVLKTPVTTAIGHPVVPCRSRSVQAMLIRLTLCDLA